MIPYEFSVLRYSYDPLTREFINVGIVVHSSAARFLQARVNTNYGRASKIFGSIDGPRYRLVLRHLQTELDSLAYDLAQETLFGPVIGTLETALSRILPVDDSSLQFERGGAGVGADLSAICEKLYRRYVTGNDAIAQQGQTREDVWRTFRKPLDRLQIANRLIPKRITGKDYDYAFEHAWKNGVWNLYEPVSFDLQDESLIREKANKWLGRSFSLSESPEAFKLTLLLGRPLNGRMRAAFQHAENILNKMPVKKEIVRDDEAEEFAKSLESQLKESESKQTA